MDWFTLLLIFFFVVLPLIEQARSKSRRGPPARRAPPEGDEKGTPARVPLPSPARVEEPASSSGGWSDEWGGWPSSEPLESPAPEPATASESAPVSPPLQRQGAPELPAPAESESARWAELLNRLPVQEEPAPRPVPPPVRTSRRKPALAPPARAAAVRPGLTGRAELRRAIILSEVLAPPLAIRIPQEYV